MEAFVPELALVHIKCKEATGQYKPSLFQALGNLNKIVHGESAVDGGFFEPLGINFSREKIVGNYHFSIGEKSTSYACVWDPIVGITPLETALNTQCIGMSRDGSAVAGNIVMPLCLSGALFVDNRTIIFDTDRFKRNSQGIFVTGISRDGKWMLLKGKYYPESDTDFFMAEIDTDSSSGIGKTYPLLVPSECSPNGNVLSEHSKTVYGWMVKNDKEYSVKWEVEEGDAKPSFLVDPSEQGCYRLSSISGDDEVKLGTFHTIFNYSDKLSTSNFPQAVVWQGSKKEKLKYPKDFYLEKNSVGTVLTECGSVGFGYCGDVIQFLNSKDSGKLDENLVPEIEAFLFTTKDKENTITPLKSFLIDFYGKRSELTDDKEEQNEIHIAMEHLSTWKLLTVDTCILGQDSLVHIAGIGVNSLGAYEAYTASFNIDKFI